MTTLQRFRTKLNLVLLLLALVVGLAYGTGWRPLRKRAGRVVELAPQLHLQWVRELPPQKPAWPDQVKLAFDVVCQPVLYEETVYVASSKLDSLLALDADSGAEKWRFTTDGPVRFAPAVWQERLYLVSDDGHLYCLDAESGHLLWKFRGGPSDRKVLGNERLISTWPARGAPVVADGVVYFAAGIWPFMGIFIHALDAETGAVVWTNDGDGSIYIKQPHFTDSFAGVAPQGTLIVAGDKLLVPGGRSVPACLDRKTGKLLYYHLGANSKTGGGSEVKAYVVRASGKGAAAASRAALSDSPARLGGPAEPRGVDEGVFVNGGAVFDLRGGDLLGKVGEQVIFGDDILYSASGIRCEALDLSKAEIRVEEAIDRKGQRVRRASWRLGTPRAVTLPARIETLARSESRLYAGMDSQVCAVDLPFRDGQTRVLTQARFEGRPAHLLAGNGRLLVSTREGKLYCFGAHPVESVSHPLETPRPIEVDDWTVRAVQLLASSGVRDGYAVVWGASSGRLLAELARQSNLRIVAFDPDEEHVTTARTELVAAGFYGERVAVHVGDPDSVQLPPYFASLMMADDPRRLGSEGSSESLRKLYASLRPYGGTLCLTMPASERGKALVDLTAASEGLVNVKVRETPDAVLLTREGKLPGSASWTHEHADSANTRVSRDQRVQAPLGLLWFGGPGNDGILPRHGHGPQPQVIGGRVFIEGIDMLRALDVYTGRLLWEASLPGLGRPFNNLAHQAGANARGTNYISTADSIYVAHGKSCLRLDPATGKTLSEFKLAPLSCDYINVHDDYLIIGGNVATPRSPAPPTSKLKGSDLSSSAILTVLDRHSGKVLWQTKTESGFRHNAICAGGGRLYAIDRPPFSWTRLRGNDDQTPARLLAFELSTGKTLWSKPKDVFGTWLSYSARHDVLVEAGRVARDSLYDEPRGMRAYQADKGTVLWFRDTYVGPAMIRGDIILKDKGACELLTGKIVERDDPITGKKIEWTWTRTYGCNTPAASEHLLTFRSGAAGYFDLCNDGGTGNFGGFRSSCTHNLVVADGILCAPDYTRTCTCSYQNQTSIALVHMPEAEMWTFYGAQEIKDTVRRVGINLGAPGNRKAANGTLWIEHPTVGGPSPKLAITVTPVANAVPTAPGAPNRVQYFRHHASQIEGEQSWIAASGVKGAATVTIPLIKSGPERTYTVRLHFVEPDRLQPGERVFDVSLQGDLLLDDFDICQEAGAANRAVVKEFKGIKVTKDLTVTLRPSEMAPSSVPVLCGVEVVAEGW